MLGKDLVNNISAAITLPPATRTADANGTGVDLRGYGSAAVIVVTGTITDGTHAITVQESDDNSTWSDVADADLIGTEPSIGAADDNKLYEIGYRGRKRYLRANVAVSGATNGGTYGAIVVRGRPQVAPV